MIKKGQLLIAALLASAITRAEDIEMADAMRANGKIFVVVGVLALVFIGLAIYLLQLDRRVRKLEERD